MPYRADMMTKDMSFGAIVPDHAELGAGSRFCIWGSSGCANLRANSHFEGGNQKCSYCRNSGYGITNNNGGSSKRLARVTEGTDLTFCIGEVHGPDPANHELPSSHFRPREPYPGENHRRMQSWKIKRDVYCDHCRGIREKGTGKLTGDPISQQTYLPTDYFNLQLSKKLDWWFSAFRRAALARKVVDEPTSLIKPEPGHDGSVFRLGQDLKFDDIPDMPIWGEINLSDPLHITQEDMASFDALIAFNNSITDEEMQVFNMTLEADMAMGSMGLPHFLRDATPATQSATAQYHLDQTTYPQDDHGHLISTPLRQSTNSNVTPHSSPSMPHTPLSSTISPTLTHSTSPAQTHFQPPRTPATPPEPTPSSSSTKATSSFPLSRKDASPELQQLLSALASCEASATCPKCNRTAPITLLFRGYMLILDELTANPDWNLCLRCSEGGLKGYI